MSEADPKRVARWMSQDLLTTKPDSAVGDALEQMEERRIRHLPVVADGALVGLLSDRDARRVLKAGEGKTVDNTTVESVMTPLAKLKTTNAFATIHEAAELMCREKISSLPVLEGKTIAGIVTTEDMLWAFLENHPE